MEKFKFPNNLWLKFGCFLSGYNYKLLSECSEASKKDVKKITSALVIICMIWASVGFIFSKKYLNTGIATSLLASSFLTVLIVQIERQIILTRTINWKIQTARFLLGFIVAMIGATVVDQYIFKQDIDKLKSDFAEERVKSRIRKDETLNNNNKIRFDSLIYINKQEIAILEEQLKRTKPTITKPLAIDPLTGKVTSLITIENPQLALINNKITRKENDNINLNNEKTKSDIDLNNTKNNQQNIQKQEEAGFLDELDLMVKFLINYKEYGKEYPVALVFYSLWLLFFLLIELSVLILKSGTEQNDYDRVVIYQQNIREERMKILEQKRTASLGEDQRIDNSGTFLNQSPR